MSVFKDHDIAKGTEAVRVRNYEFKGKSSVI